MDYSIQIASSKTEIIKLIQGAVQINSVEGLPKPGMPFGEGPAKALQYFLRAADKIGFEYENYDNYAGHITLDVGAVETIGILCHVDVVPAGDDWICDPYSAEIIDNKIYGRGTLDNKGPAAVCLYTMKILRDMDIPFKRNIKLILGTNEETGWGCMNHYFNIAKAPKPDFAFTPDSTFPVIYAEKGLMQFKLKKSLSSPLSLSGGIAFNSVPDFASIEIDSKYFTAVVNSTSGLFDETGCSFNLTRNGDMIRIEVQGLAAHSAHLTEGKNAISALFKVLSTLSLDDELKQISDFYSQFIGLSMYGEYLGISDEDDESGKLTCNIGRVYVEDGQLVIGADVRVPVTHTLSDICDKLSRKLTCSGFEIEYYTMHKPLYVSKDSFLVKTLMSAYCDVTGNNDAIPLTSGGGTYARAIDNCVAFGSLFDDQEKLIHSKNEFLDIGKIDEWLEIYLEAIRRLATE
jgi:succinyl-diaminopimelate desuccinylase